MHYVEKHLRERAAKYADRYANPVTAWDQIGARSWSERCEQLAEVTAPLAPEAAMQYLHACRAKADGVDGLLDSSQPMAFIVSMDMAREMDTIIDPIAVAHRGWIEAQVGGGLDDGKLSTRPAYRRMLGVNHCVAYCGRERGESDDAWLSRREQWFARYHPDVWVVSREAGYGWGIDGGQCSSLLGRVADFMKVPHLRMATDICIACDLPTAKRRRPAWAASYSTECGPMCGVCHAEKVPHRHQPEENNGLPAGLKLVAAS